MFGNGQLLQVDFIRPSPPHVSEGLKAFRMNTNLCIHLSYINIVATMFVVDEGRMKST